MSAFLSGGAIDCGPTNVLKNVTGRLDRDQSLQQDRLVSVPNVAGSSKQPFRGQVSSPPPAGFASSIPQQTGPSAFDLASLRQHLSPAPPQNYRQVHGSPQTSSWADGFAPHPQVGSSRAQSRVTSPPPQMNGWQQEFEQHVYTPPQQARSIPTTRQAGPAPWQTGPYQPMLPHTQPFHPGMPYHTLPPTPLPQQELYHPAQTLNRPSTAPPEQQSRPAEPLTESQDLLSRTARTFVDDLEHSSEILSSNPKLAQSKFMTLLRGLGDGGLVVDEGEAINGEEVGEGAKLVGRSTNTTANWAGDFLLEETSAQGQVRNEEPATTAQLEEIARMSPYPQGQKVYPALDSWMSALPAHSMSGSAMNDAKIAWDQQFRDQEALVQSNENVSQRTIPQRRKSVHFTESSSEHERSGVPKNLEEALASATSIPGAGQSWAEDGMFDDGDFDEETFAAFNGTMRQAPEPVSGVGAREGWGDLQSDWEQFQRTEPGSKGLRGMGRGDKVERYLFQSRNPYASAAVGFHLDPPRNSSTLKGILELEAAVQQEPTSPDAWYNLGLKQQENEREDQAILALSKVIQLEPDYRPAYLALAVSYTNEGEAEAACTVLERWIRLGEEGRVVEGVEQGKARWGDSGRERLVERLIDMARQNPEEVDADVQVALGVLFNASEEYQKAEDCFLAASAARPDDWLLYNRLGATLANSGRSNEAIKYYHKALSLHPNFVRALFNLGISYMNLGQYPLAAQSSLDALRLQHADASEGYLFGEAGGGAKGVTSDALWNSLRGACMHMSRQDLVHMVEKRDLSGFPLSFVDALQSSA
ncbi:hypothetical protein CI109_104358 [Kwoniella shandongensis]|uniref:Uncharacterized protein n=1 Tax=Kwoniella shandongensis TaxID=1734106 RepID=A0A5M6BYX1_9TREE|nr:uncharacterized protein CI109_004246 [Kwoniella shandongensis]KAA5527430.1 hypothetical protein CI109_004246 [Kwoniella shandongensis]